jgi:hypothetical protein
LRVPPVPVPEREVLAQRIADDYLADQSVVEALGRSYGFSTVFVWQVTVADKASLSPQERRYAGWLPTSRDTNPAIGWWSMSGEMHALYDAVRRRVTSSGHVVDLADSLNGIAGTAFIDWMHPSETGNEAIARELYARLAPQLHLRHQVAGQAR